MSKTDLATLVAFATLVVGAHVWLGAMMTAPREARRRARRHLRAAAIALLSGDTSAYQMVPTLPRKPGSTDLYGSTHRGDDHAA